MFGIAPEDGVKVERLRKCPASPLREVVRLLGPHEDGCQAIHAPAELPSVGRGHHPIHHEIGVPPCVPDVAGGLMPALPLRQPADFAPRLALVRRDADAEVSAMPKYVDYAISNVKAYFSSILRNVPENFHPLVFPVAIDGKEISIPRPTRDNLPRNSRPKVMKNGIPYQSFTPT